MDSPLTPSLWSTKFDWAFNWMSWVLVAGIHSLVRSTELWSKFSKLQFLTFVNNSFWLGTHWNWKMFVKYKVVDLWIRFPIPLSFPSSDAVFERYGRFAMIRFLHLLNYHLSKKLKFIGKDKLNHLIITLTLFIMCELKLSFNRWDSTRRIFNLNIGVNWQSSSSISGPLALIPC